MTINDKLKALDITLPPVSVPAAAYVPFVQTGKLVFLSGHIARKDGKPWVGQFGKNITTADYVFQARGIVLLLAAQKRIPVYEPKPSQIKSVVCGYGNAEKAQVQKMVQRLLSLDVLPKPDDAADALAAALTGLLLQKTSSLLPREGGVS